MSILVWSPTFREIAEVNCPEVQCYILGETTLVILIMVDLLQQIEFQFHFWGPL